MKICDLTQSYAETGGGVRTYLHAKRDHVLGRTAHKHVLIVPDAEDGVSRTDRAVTYRIASPRIPGAGAYRFMLRSDKVLRILEAERPDVIEVQCAYTLPWTALWHRRRRGGLVIGCMMTDVAAAYVEPAVARAGGRRAARTARRLADRYARALYRRLDATMVPSPALAERLRRLGVAADRVACIPLGVDLDLFHPARRDAAVRRELGAADEDLLLIYAGRLDSERRPDLVMDAFERLPASASAVLVLAGDGPLRAALAERARENGRARVLGFIADRAPLATLLASADLYVSAMPHETFGLAVLEAQACGLAVVGVRAGAMTERVTSGCGALVEPGSPAALAHCIAAVPREEWRRRGRNARAHVERRFSWDHTFEQTLALCDRLLSRDSR